MNISHAPPVRIVIAILMHLDCVDISIRELLASFLE